jgi:hypothetical protein
MGMPWQLLLICQEVNDSQDIPFEFRFDFEKHITKKIAGL